MIYAVQGTLTSLGGNAVAITTQAGIAYECLVPSVEAFSPHNSLVYCHLHWNQEQGPALYGFPTLLDRNFFRLLIETSGVGPKLAISMLSQASVEDLVEAIAARDERRLSSLQGIGKKKAEQLIVALADKSADFAREYRVSSGSNTQQLVDVLTSLNYSKQEIQAAVKAVRDTFESKAPSFDEQMRVALSTLSKLKAATL